MSIKTKIKSLFALDDEYEYKEQEVYEEEEVEPRKTRSSIHQNNGQSNVVSLQSVQKTSKVILMEPRSYSEATDIADHLKNRRAVIVNLQRAHQEEARQIVDFLSGTVYAISGEIQKVGVNIFLCTPDTVDVAGSITEFLQHDNQSNNTEIKRW
ncbi:cell division protein SepF [Sutcliffiella cohnii]